MRRTDRHWSASVTAGAVSLSGADVDEGPDGAVRFRLGWDLTERTFAAGDYAVGSFHSESVRFQQPQGAIVEHERHTFHLVIVGPGLRVDLAPGVRATVLPGAGVLLGDEIDAGLAGSLSAGVEVEIRPNLWLTIEASGLLLDGSVSTPAGEADLEAGWFLGVGLTLRF